MSNRKNTVGGSPGHRESGKFRADQIDESAERPLQKIEITSLKIEPDQDAGCDPYNSTGQFCVIKDKS